MNSKVRFNIDDKDITWADLKEQDDENLTLWFLKRNMRQVKPLLPVVIKDSHDAQEVLNRCIMVNGPMRIFLHYSWIPSTHVVASTLVPHRDTGDLVEVQTQVPTVLPMKLEDFVLKATEAAFMLYLHEFHETWYVDGKRVLDPHA